MVPDASAPLPVPLFTCNQAAGCLMAEDGTAQISFRLRPPSEPSHLVRFQADVAAVPESESFTLFGVGIVVLAAARKFLYKTQARG